MPKVSVIVPNYNHASYLKQRFDSIFNQTFQDFEVIILDDCSTDNSREIIEEYRNKPQVSHIVYNETNSGSPFKQWAKGFELAKGEYIWIAESDDWAEPEFLQTLLKQVKLNSKNVISFCNSFLENGNSSIEYPISRKDFQKKGSDFVHQKMLFDNAIYNASSAIFSKDSLAYISENFKNFRSAGDYQFWLELSLNSNVFYCTRPLNHFRIHNFSTTKIHKENFHIYNELLQILLFLRERDIISNQLLQAISLHYKQILKNKKAPTHIIKPWKSHIHNYFIAYIQKKLYFLKNSIY